ncbi:hypothetical protein AMTR_s00156p00031630 [Amborella trichopoda]|uniref:Uncharacterized protein n=1 Tax=Amborella trichopoda TaxID=13333 RepID=W1PMB0_AMBTC|nr:hypothetical protein AMTR_s00156p00031630 [Amborella trichopoda]
MWTDCATCFESCASNVGACGTCLGGAGEAGLPILLIVGIIVLGFFTVVGIFYSVLVATMVGQRIWERHYHILAKRMLAKGEARERADLTSMKQASSSHQLQQKERLKFSLLTTNFYSLPLHESSK